MYKSATPSSVLLLGSNSDVLNYVPHILRYFSGSMIYQCTYGDAVLSDKFEGNIVLERGRELEAINATIKGPPIGVVSRSDAHTHLAGMLVDEFDLSGSGLEALLYFRDKARMHELMVDLGLAAFRPKTEIWISLEEMCSSWLFDEPKILKPSGGFKSRGVFKVANEHELKLAIDYVSAHFSSDYFQNIGIPPRVLVEEVVEGWQVTPLCYVDAGGVLKVLDYVDVYTGIDEGLGHNQLMYRTTDSRIGLSERQSIEQLLQQLIDATRLRSIFLHPELIVTRSGVKLIEINTRLGGYRSGLMRHAKGFDLEEMVVQLAAGMLIEDFKHLGPAMSATAVEVWETESGIIDKVVVPISDLLCDIKIGYGKGVKYLAPPQGNRPLATFYVVSDACSLEKAKDLRSRVTVSYLSN